MALVLSLVSAWAQAAATAPAPAVGDVPPQLLGTDRNGDSVDLAKLRGKVVVVTFWASWCGYCRKELPALNEMQTRAGPDYFRVVAVNVQDGNDEYRAMTRQMRDYTLTFARDRSGGIAESYGVKSYPNLWIIDPEGRVAGRHIGYGEDSFGEIVGEITRVIQDEVDRLHAASATGAASSG
ncbi:MAG: TlpA disulfide reductase family protein [Thermomonas sp.]